MFLYAFYRKHLLLLRVIAFFFMGLFVAIGIALYQLDLESLRGNILSALRDNTNMPIEIDGKISWNFSLRPEIELNDVRIPNADWAKNKNMFTAKKIDVRLDLLSLFKSHPVIRYIKVFDAKIAIENKDWKTFNMRPQGNYDERKKQYKEGKKYIGKCSLLNIGS